MIGALFNFVSLVIAAGVGLFTFALARQYVRSRLRFVDAVRTPIAPWVAGLAAWMIAVPIAALLPLITGLTALVFGAATGLGTASGVKALQRGE